MRFGSPCISRVRDSARAGKAEAFSCSVCGSVGVVRFDVGKFAVFHFLGELASSVFVACVISGSDYVACECAADVGVCAYVLLR